MPNQVRSWDITKPNGPAKWTRDEFYVILGVYSRYVVGWMIAERESAELGAKRIEQTIAQQRTDHGQLTVHANRGSSMTSKDVALLLANLGITKTHSRPRVSNDNLHSETHFKSLKYRPEFLERFGSIADALAFCRAFFDRHNRHNRHLSIAMITPHGVRRCRADEIVADRTTVRALAHQRHPERFVQGSPAQQSQPGPAWINAPTTTAPLGAAAHGAPMSCVSESFRNVAPKVSRPRPCATPRAADSRTSANFIDDCKETRATCDVRLGTGESCPARRWKPPNSLLWFAETRR